MKTTYEVWAQALDSDECVTDEDCCLGSFDTQEEAEERFNQLTEADAIKGAPYTLFSIEVVENTEDFAYSECVDIITDWIC